MDKYDLLPEQDLDNDKWINEKNEIHNNNKINLANELMNKCKMLGSECVMYKINGETYSKYYYFLINIYNVTSI